MRFAAAAALAIGSLAATVAADGASIVAALNKIDQDTIALNSSVTKSDGSLIGSLPVLSASGTLLQDLDQGTKTAQASAELNTTEAIQVYTAVSKLQHDVNSTLSNLINAEPRFNKNLLDETVAIDLKLTKQKTDKFAAAVVAVVPSAFQSIAQGIVTSIDNSFAEAIAAYTNQPLPALSISL